MQTKQLMLDMNPKKNKKLKETLKLVRKIDETQLENIGELVNQIFI